MRNLCIAVAAASVVAMSAAVASAEPAAPPVTTGSVVAVQPLSAPATLPGSVNSVRIEYGSTTVGDQPTTTSAAVYFPPGPAPEGGWPVIAWAHGKVGLADDCAYSVAGPADVQRDWNYLGTWLNQGYAIVAADYAGLGTPGDHPYLNGRVEAHNVVDAVKAATRQYPDLSKKWVVVGQSQGGGAAVATARYATEFGAGELDYRGAVGTGVPAYIENVLLPLGPGVPPVGLGPHTTAYVFYILDGLRVAYPNLDIESYLTDSGREWLARARTSCINEFGDELAAKGVRIGDQFARPLSRIPDLLGVLTSAMGLPETGYDRPLFLGQGLRDTDVITPATLLFAGRLLINGQPVTLHTYPEDHSGTVNASLRDSLPFVRGLFA